MLIRPTYRLVGNAGAATAPIVRLLFLSIAQSALMLASTAAITGNRPLANWIYNHARSLADYIPALWRFGNIFEASNRHPEFVQIFAIYSSYLILEGIFLVIIFTALYKELEPSQRINNRILRDWGFFLLILIGVAELAHFLLGPYDIRSSSLVNGNYYWGLYVYCLGVPGANFVSSLAVYSRYGRSMAGIDAVRP